MRQSYWPLIRKLEKMHSKGTVSTKRGDIESEQMSAQAIKDELSGTYVYPVPAPVKIVEPKPEPPAAPEPDNLENILAQKRQQLLEDLSRYGQINQFVGRDARAYLDGGFR